MLDRIGLVAQAAAEGRDCVVGALIRDELGRVFVHRRAWNRRLFPGCWDIVGGHVEPGEDLLQALDREVEEETGWHLHGVPRLIYVADWEIDGNEPPVRRREFDFLVDVVVDLRRPRLEHPKHVEFRWLRHQDLDLLNENRETDFGLVRRVVELALRSRSIAPGFSEPHATIFLESGRKTDEIESLRHRWDPAMAYQIAAHITVAYPSEASDLDDMVKRTAHASRTSAPFHLWLGGLSYEDEPIGWAFVEVEDPDASWARLRRLIVRAEEPSPRVVPHVTIVHPRHTNRGRAALASTQPVDGGARCFGPKCGGDRLRWTPLGYCSDIHADWLTVATKFTFCALRWMLPGRSQHLKMCMPTHLATPGSV